MQLADNPAPGFKDNPGHRITVTPFNGTVNVMFSDAMLASTKRAKVLREDGHDPVYYIPFEDIYFDFLRPTEKTSYCPYKGNASYWGVTAVGEALPDVMWAYRAPFDEMAAIKDHGAFDAEKVRIELTPPADTGVGKDI